MVISVVVPAYNAAWCLGQLLASLAVQTTPLAFEVIVADNGSSDDTGEVARRSGATLVDASQVRGPAAARNGGVRASRGEVVVFLDADDVVDPAYLHEIAAALEGVDLVGARVDQERLNPGWPGQVRTIEQRTGLPTIVSSTRRDPYPWIYGATLAMRREVFDRLEGFDEALLAGEDIDLAIRANELGLTLRFAPRAIVHCRLRSTLPSIFRQGVKYGGGGARVEHKYRALGRPLDHVVGSEQGPLRYAVAPLRSLIRCRTKAALAATLFLIGRRVGYFAVVLRLARRR